MLELIVNGFSLINFKNIEMESHFFITCTSIMGTPVENESRFYSFNFILEKNYFNLQKYKI